MVTIHSDAYGYKSGKKELLETNAELSSKGDSIATFMGWMKKPEAGGGTSFTAINTEGLVESI